VQSDLARNRAGERAGNRTPNLVVKSHLLCQLSYAPGGTLECRRKRGKSSHGFLASLEIDHDSFGLGSDAAV
jgi:hypothetical protein